MVVEPLKDPALEHDIVTTKSLKVTNDGIEFDLYLSLGECNLPARLFPKT